MALFTDGPLGSVEDLHRYDSSVLDTAAAEGVDLTAKLQISKLEVGMEVSSLLGRNDRALTGTELKYVLVTEPVLHAQCLHTLELAYRDAYNNQLNDRFAGKAKEYFNRYRRALSLLGELGVAVVSNPVGKAAAPVCSYTPGGSLPDTTYFVAIRWINAAGCAGATSDAAVVQAPAGTLPATTCVTGSGVAGWHVLAGLTGDTMTRQTDAALASGATWTLNPSGLRSDLPSLPDLRIAAYISDGRRLRRG